VVADEQLTDQGFSFADVGFIFLVQQVPMLDCQLVDRSVRPLQPNDNLLAVGQVARMRVDVAAHLQLLTFQVAATW